MNFSLIFANFPPTPNRCLLLLPLVLVAISHPTVSAEAKNCVDFTASVSICFTFPFAHCTTANLRQIYREQFVLTVWFCVCKRNILAIVLDCFIQWISSTTNFAKFSQKLIQRRPTIFLLSSNAMQKSRAKLLHPLINSWGSCCFSLRRKIPKWRKTALVVKIKFEEEENLFEWNACLAIANKNENLLLSLSITKLAISPQRKGNEKSIKTEIFLNYRLKEHNELSWPLTIIFWFIQKSICDGEKKVENIY